MRTLLNRMLMVMLSVTVLTLGACVAPVAPAAAPSTDKPTELAGAPDVKCESTQILRTYAHPTYAAHCLCHPKVLQDARVNFALGVPTHFITLQVINPPLFEML